jgi:hypothetical protein
MEKNVNILRDALAKLPSSGPSDLIWAEIERKLSETPLKKALDKLPEFEPDEFVWEAIKSKTAKSTGKIGSWWYAAAVLLIAGIGGLWLAQRNPAPTIAFSQEVIDARLQLKNEDVTDVHYEKLKAYCEAETTVCSNKNFKRLQDEYETLQTAGQHLQQAMGKYNTEPELVRQFSIVEREKAELLNEMAKMI